MQTEVAPDHDQAKIDRQTENVYKKISETLSFLAYKETTHRPAALISIRTVEGLTIPDMETLVACLVWLLRYRKVKLGHWKTYLKEAIPRELWISSGMRDVMQDLNSRALDRWFRPKSRENHETVPKHGTNGSQKEVVEKWQNPVIFTGFPFQSPTSTSPGRASGITRTIPTMVDGTGNTQLEAALLAYFREPFRGSTAEMPTPRRMAH